MDNHSQTTDLGHGGNHVGGAEKRYGQRNNGAKNARQYEDVLNKLGKTVTARFIGQKGSRQCIMVDRRSAMVEVAQRTVTPQNNGTFHKTFLRVHPIVYIVQKLPNRLLFPAVADKKAYQLIHPGQKQ